MRLLISGTLAFNVVVMLCILGVEIARGGHFEAPWDGPAVATLMLGAATIVLTAVAVMAGLLAVWGYTTLREHAGSIAAQAAKDAMGPAAEAAAERVVKRWLNWPEDTSPDQIA